MSDDDDLRHGRLVVADGWRVDPLSAARLDRQLGRAPADVVAVVAGTTPLPPGSSHRVHAERMALAPWDAVEPIEGDAVLGAAVVRRGATVAVDGATLASRDGPLLRDDGAHAHDPTTIRRELRPASPLGRPPFPRRPVTVFLGAEPGAPGAAWAGPVVDALIDSEVEARLFPVEPVDPPALVQPAAATEQSLDALHPDVVVALDREALEWALTWCGDNRTMTVIEWLDEARSTELVSWRIDDDHGRLRARVGNTVTGAELAALVARLCGGPQPLPPPLAAGVAP